MKKGDIILIPFPFTDLSGSKNRPALVLIDQPGDITVCFLTTQLHYQSKYDIQLNPTPINGLKKTSVVRLNKIATIDKELALGKLGNMTRIEIDTLNTKLMELFKINRCSYTE